MMWARNVFCSEKYHWYQELKERRETDVGVPE